MSINARIGALLRRESADAGRDYADLGNEWMDDLARLTLADAKARKQNEDEDGLDDEDLGEE